MRNGLAICAKVRLLLSLLITTAGDGRSPGTDICICESTRMEYFEPTFVAFQLLDGKVKESTV